MASNSTLNVSTFDQSWGIYIMCLSGVGIVTALGLFGLLVWFILKHKNYPHASIVPIQCCLLSAVIVYLYLIFVIPNTYFASPIFGLVSVWIFTCLTCHAYHLVAHPKRRNEDGMWSFILMFFVVVAVQLLFGVSQIAFALHDGNNSRNLFHFTLFNMTLPITVLFFGSLAAFLTPARKGEEYTGNGLGATIVTNFVLWVLFFALCMAEVFKNWEEVYKMLTIFTVYILYICYAVTEVFTVLAWLEQQEEEDKLTVKKVVNGILKSPLPFTKPPLNLFKQPPPYEDKDPLLPV
ncbi:G protein coupled receptor 4B [Elephant endotheliotropic herpesvirus 6]|nr:G protein coupled receptor 4B [Elephant endotheliotropic herpesvirus 6]